MRSVHESSKWFTELQTWARLFRHVEDSRIAHHRRNARQKYGVRLVHLMGFCPSLVFLTLQTRYLFLWACFCFVFLFEDFCTQKKRTKWKHARIFQMKTVCFHPPYFLKGFLILSCHFHSCVSILLLPSCFPGTNACISHIPCVLHVPHVPASSIG